MPICLETRPVYRPHTQGGVNFAGSQDDGYTIAIEWDRAYPSTLGQTLAYNIYYSTIREDVFTEGPKFVSIDTSYLNTCIQELTPGDTYYFATRATEFDSTIVNLSLLPDGFPNLKVYPETMLLSDISDTATEIPIADIDIFPAFGVIVIGTEYIKYSSKDIPNNSLIVSERGYLGTNVRYHQTDGYDGVAFQSTVIRFWEGFEEKNEHVLQETANFDYPNYARTNADGYKTQTEDLLTTDLSASDENMEDFTPYDYAGWHRTDPAALLRGDCIGTYYGGEQFCADGYLGVGRQIRGVPFQEENARRQEILLSLTGEPCVLVRRLWKGIRCKCYKSSTEHVEHRCHTCFIPGTLVNTIDGLKPIEDISAGELVLTHDGSYQRVSQTMKRPYRGLVRDIRTSVTADPIIATGDHPFLVLRGSHQNKLSTRKCGPKCNLYIKNGDGFNNSYDIRQLASGKYHARLTDQKGKRKIIGSFSSKAEAINKIDEYKKHNFVSGHHLKWENASLIEKKDWLVYKTNKLTLDQEFIKIPKKFLKNTKLGEKRLGPSVFRLDEEFLWIIGMYLAEGSVGKRSLSFALHKDEVEYQDRIVSWFENKGLNPFIRKTSNNGVAVNVSSTTMSLWFKKWLGSSCYHKKIPQELMFLPPNKIKSLIQGIYDGDGDKSCNEIGQTSKILALQLVELLQKIGEQPLLRVFDPKILTPKGNNRAMVYYVNWADNSFLRENRKGRWNFGEECLTRVVTSSNGYYEGYVYNLEVENNNTYTVQGIVVHNCFGTGFVTGYNQFFNPRRSDGKIFVRFNPTKDDLKFENSGLESEFIPECWTTVFPAVKDRDFIIRFNEDGTEEFRYEILDVTRNKLLEGFSGKQGFTAKRVRKTSPIYMWRAIRNTATMPMTLNTSVGMVPGPGGIDPHTHTIVINEGIVSLSQINQTTGVSEGHNHPIISGVVQEVLGHKHEIIL